MSKRPRQVQRILPENMKMFFFDRKGRVFRILSDQDKGFRLCTKITDSMFCQVPIVQQYK